MPTTTEYVIVNGEALELMEDGRFPLYFHFPETTRLFDATCCPPRLVPLVEEEGDEKGVTLFRLIPHAPYFAYSVASPTEQIIARRIIPMNAHLMGGFGIGLTSSIHTPTDATTPKDLSTPVASNDGSSSPTGISSSASPASDSSNSNVGAPSPAVTAIVPRSVLDDIYSAIPQSSTVFPALRCDHIDRKVEFLGRVVTAPKVITNPDGQTTNIFMYDRRNYKEINMFRNTMEHTDQRGLYRYIIVHGLPASTTAEDIGKYFEAVKGQYIYEADVCTFEDPATGRKQCSSTAFVEVQDLGNGTFKLLLERYLEFHGGSIIDVIGSDRKPIVEVPRFEPFPTTVGPAPHREHIEPVRRQHNNTNNMYNGDRYNNNNGGMRNNFNNNGEDGNGMRMHNNRHNNGGEMNNNGFNNNGERRFNNNNGEYNNNNRNNGFNNPNSPNSNTTNSFQNNNGRPRFQQNSSGYNNGSSNNYNNNGPIRDTRESRTQEPLHAHLSGASSSNGHHTPTNSMNQPIPPAAPPRCANGNSSAIYCVGHINEQVAEASVQDGIFMPSKRAFDQLTQLTADFGAVYLIVIYDRQPMLFGLARVLGKAGNGQLAVQWTAPHRNLYPNDLPAGMLNALGVGPVSTKEWFDGLRLAEKVEGKPAQGNLSACQRLQEFLENDCKANPDSSPTSSPTTSGPSSHSMGGYRNAVYGNSNNNMHVPVHQGMPRRTLQQGITPL